MPDNVTPKEREALLAAFSAAGHTLKRTRDGFASPATPEVAFTRRTMNWLDNRAWIRYDDPDVPRAATLTQLGIKSAQELTAAGATKVRAR